jgi:hypothetical protein
MRISNLPLVQESVLLLAQYTCDTRYPLSSPVLDHFRTLFYLLTIITNSGTPFDPPLRELAFSALIPLLCDDTSDFCERALSAGLLPRLGDIFSEHIPSLDAHIPAVLGVVGRHCERCREAVAAGVPGAVLHAFVFSADPTIRERGLETVVALCRGPLPDETKRTTFAECLLSVFSQQHWPLYSLALLGIAFWIENEDPTVSCFGVFWETDTTFSLHFAALFSDSDATLIVNLLRLVAAVLRRGESVPGLPVPVVVQLLRRPDPVLPSAVRVLGLLAQRTEYQHSLIANRMLEELRAVLETAAFDVKEEVALCVATIVRYGNTAVRLDVIERKGVSMLVGALGSSQNEVVVDVVNAIAELILAGERRDGSNSVLEILEAMDGWGEIRALLDHPLEEVAGLVEELLAYAECEEEESEVVRK